MQSPVGGCGGSVAMYTVYQLTGLPVTYVHKAACGRPRSGCIVDRIRQWPDQARSQSSSSSTIIPRPDPTGRIFYASKCCLPEYSSTLSCFHHLLHLSGPAHKQQQRQHHHHHRRHRHQWQPVRQHLPCHSWRLTSDAASRITSLHALSSPLFVRPRMSRSELIRIIGGIPLQKCDATKHAGCWSNSAIVPNRKASYSQC